jgi:predicted membrane-bound spermidine synthase
MITSPQQRWFMVLSVTFFVSGFSALLYQVAWQRVLGLFAGSDVRSVTIITGAYLAGLGVGSLLGTLVADRLSRRRAVQLFGLCNLGIALFAFGSRLLFYDLLFREFHRLAESLVVTLVLVFVSLLWPTTLMGLSLPLLSKASVSNLSEAASLITILYGINTLGAAIGTIGAGWYLIGTLGLERVIYVGGGLSSLVGFIALLVAGRLAGTDAAITAAPAVPVESKGIPLRVWGWGLLVFVSGFIAISLELAWFRLLEVVLESTAYTFAYLLTFILLGYVVGNLAGILYLKRVEQPGAAFLWLQGLTVLYAVGMMWAIAWGIQAEPFKPYLNGIIERFSFIPPLLLLIPNFLIGFYFPIVQQAVQTDPQVVGQRVGLVQLANIGGNTAGSIVTGLVLLEFWGISGTVRVIAGLGLFLTLILLWENFGSFRWWGKAGSGGLAASLLVSVAAFPGLLQYWAWVHQAPLDEPFYLAEDSSGVAAIRDLADKAVIYSNGEDQGNIPYLTMHSFLGSLPALIHPHPRQALVIGIASTGTPYSIGVNPALQQITAVEIVGAQLSVLTAYAATPRGQAVKALLNDPRYQIIIGDGRRELALSQQKFDLIEADPIYPWKSRSGLLFSREFYELASGHLAPDGIMTQWLPKKRALAAFLSVFPYVVRLGDVTMGSHSPIPFDQSKLLQRLEDPPVVAYLERGGVNLAELRQLAHMQPTFWLPDTPRDLDDMNTDLFPKDEYFLNN